MKKDRETLEERLLRIDWPHTRNGRAWNKNAGGVKRMVHYTKELMKLGMTAEQAAFMFGDIYWDAFGDFKAMPKEEGEPQVGTKKTVPHYDEYGIMFELKARELSADELKRDFEFYCNAFAREGKLWWTNSGGVLMVLWRC